MSCIITEANAVDMNPSSKDKKADDNVISRHLSNNLTHGDLEGESKAYDAETQRAIEGDAHFPSP